MDKNNLPEEKEEEKDKPINNEKDHMITGLTYGMLAGSAVGSIIFLLGIFDIFAMLLGPSIGMVFGMIIGMSIEKS